MKRLNLKQLILIVMFLGALIGALTTTFLYFKLSKFQVPKEIQPKSSLLTTSADSNINLNKTINILLLGYGGAGHDGGTLSDSIIIANVNSTNKSINLISIPRDLWVPLPYDWDNLQNFKLNEAYAIGGNDTKYANKKPEFRGETGRGNLAKYAVQIVTGIPMDYYIAVDFAGLTKAINLLGGIEVNVPNTFDDYFYPVKGLENETCGKTAAEIAELHQKYSGFDLEKQFTCRYEHIHFDKGLQTINGESALKFVRSRHSNESGGDFARSVRQFVVLTGIKNKIISADIITKADPVFDQLVSVVKTDIDNTVIISLVNLLKDYQSYKITTINLTDQNVLIQSKSPSGQYILIPKEGVNKWSEIQKFIDSNIGN